MPHARSRFGMRGEDLAAAYLESQGYCILDRNVRTPCGELDIVCRFDAEKEIVFVEVKARASHAFGSPEASVTTMKQRHLIRSAQWYLAAHRDVRRHAYRIDVIAITYRGDTAPELQHIRSACGEV